MKALMDTEVPIPELTASTVTSSAPASPVSPAPMPNPRAEYRLTLTPLERGGFLVLGDRSKGSPGPCVLHERDEGDDGNRGDREDGGPVPAGMYTPKHFVYPHDDRWHPSLLFAEEDEDQALQQESGPGGEQHGALFARRHPHGSPEEEALEEQPDEYQAQDRCPQPGQISQPSTRYAVYMTNPPSTYI